MGSGRFNLIASSLVLGLSAGPVAAADCPGGCAAPAGPAIVYGPAPAVVDVPPVGYVLDPSDARKPIYVVNQGPVYSGPLIVTYAVPTYSEGGYAYGTPYPYVRTYGAYNWTYDQRFFYAPHRHRYGARGAYAYRPAPSARIIHIPAR
jgi:hypothetical protein